MTDDAFDRFVTSRMGQLSRELKSNAATSVSYANAVEEIKKRGLTHCFLTLTRECICV